MNARDLSVITTLDLRIEFEKTRCSVSNPAQVAKMAICPGVAQRKDPVPGTADKFEDGVLVT